MINSRKNEQIVKGANKIDFYLFYPRFILDLVPDDTVLIKTSDASFSKTP